MPYVRICGQRNYKGFTVVEDFLRQKIHFITCFSRGNVFSLNFYLFLAHKTPINVPASYYSKYVSDNVSIKMRAVAMVPSTEQSVIKSVYCTLGKPNLEFEDMPDNFTWQTATEFKVAFTNPLDTELTNCEMHVDGSIMTGQMYFDKIA